MASTIGRNQRAIITPAAIDTPTQGSGGVFTIACSTTINAPITTIMAALLDTSTYPTWNTFCPNIKINSQPPSQASLPPSLSSLSSLISRPDALRLGTAFTLEAHLEPGNKWKVSQAPCQVSYLEEIERDGRRGIRVAWKTAGWAPGFMLKTERIQELVPSEEDENVIEYVNWETFYGLLGTTVKYVAGGGVVSGFDRWMDGLKEYSEKQAQGL